MLKKKGNVCKKHKNKRENKLQSEHECENGCDEIEKQHAGATCVITNDRLRVIDENIQSQEENQEEVNREILNEEAAQETLSKEVS